MRAENEERLAKKSDNHNGKLSTKQKNRVIEATRRSREGVFQLNQIDFLKRRSFSFERHNLETFMPLFLEL